jgi:hypothetical protein
MKNLQFFLGLGLATIFVACTPEPKTGATNTATNNTPINVEAWAEPAVPAESNRETALLTKDYWVFEYYVIPGNQQQSILNRGLWYKLAMNGTFEYGHWEDYLGKGTWKLTYDSNMEGRPKIAGMTSIPVLVVDSETDNAYDMMWELSFGDYSGSEASFVASRYSQQPGVMCKTLNLMTQPTKKQFGYE